MAGGHVSLGIAGAPDSCTLAREKDNPLPPNSPREFAFVCACCAWPRSEERDVSVRGMAAEGLDWPRVAALAARHRVEGLVQAALRAAAVSVPAEASAHFAARAREVAARSLASAAEAARIQARLRDAGVASLILKGAAVEMLAYGALGRKDAWDIDVLVAPADAITVCGLLVQDGYVLTSPVGLSPAQIETWVALARECEFSRPGGSVVELHWGLADGPVLLPSLGVASPSCDVAINPGLRLATFAREENFAYLCVHGAMHGWGRLKWLADLAALLSHETPQGIEALYRRSRELGVGLCPAQALLLCERLFGLELGSAFAAELENSSGVRSLLRYADAAMQAADPPAAMTWSRLVVELRLVGGGRAALAQLRYRLVGVHDRIHAPLPPSLRLLYPIMRAPSWLWRRRPGGR